MIKEIIDKLVALLGIGVGEVSLIIGLHEKEKQSAE